jgi:hypothetical protein
MSDNPARRRALNRLAELDLDVCSDASGVDESPLWVERDGCITIAEDGGSVTTTGQGRLDVLNLLGPSDPGVGAGPDVVRCRPLLRIVPGKAAGEPHLNGSRLTTLTVALTARPSHILGSGSGSPLLEPPVIPSSAAGRPG